MNLNETIIRVFEVQAKSGCADDLLKKLASTSVSVVEGKQGNLGYFFGKQPSTDTHDFVFVSVWTNLAAVKAHFGEEWETSFLPPGYADLIEACSIKHFEVNGKLD